jgi:hypothetical protein
LVFREVNIMKNVIVVVVGVFTLLTALRCFPNAYAQNTRSESAVATEQPVLETTPKTARPRVGPVKMVDFYLRDGEKLVFGKLVSQDRNKITVEHLDKSRIIVSTYSKREIDTRTLNTKNTSQVKYWLDLVEYFSGRTWDFRDDPDDFIQAIRCCEKAKQAVAQAGRQNSGRIEQINKKIEQLKADREIWTSQVESRAKLKKLELEATFETRLKELEDNFVTNSQKLDKIMADMKDNQQRLENLVADLDLAMGEQVDILRGEIDANRRIIERIDRMWYPRRYYYYP